MLDAHGPMDGWALDAAGAPADALLAGSPGRGSRVGSSGRP